MPGPRYQKSEKKFKTYKDYLKKYEKECEDKGIDPISDKFSNYIQNK